MEEYLLSLTQIKDRVLDFPIDQDGQVKMNKDMYDLNQLCRADKRLLELRKGNKVIGAKDYMLVFFITCFLPFVRPSIPQLKESEIHRAKKS